jgi:hypothetical protein
MSPRTPRKCNNNIINDFPLSHHVILAVQALYARDWIVRRLEQNGRCAWSWNGFLLEIFISSMDVIPVVAGSFAFGIWCPSVLTPYFCRTWLIQSSLGKHVALENVEDFYTSWKIWCYYLCKATGIEDSDNGDLWSLNTPVAPKYL